MFLTQALRSRMEKARRATARERRVWVRQKCTLDSSCQPLAAQLEMKWEAETRDMAPGGICLRARRRFEPGTFLTIEFEPTGEGALRFVTARVVHIAPERDGFWRIGCQFPRPLVEDEFQAMV
jgi:PilZ domain